MDSSLGEKRCNQDQLLAIVSVVAVDDKECGHMCEQNVNVWKRILQHTFRSGSHAVPHFLLFLSITDYQLTPSKYQL
jgi:hypothetical protein